MQVRWEYLTPPDFKKLAKEELKRRKRELCFRVGLVMQYPEYQLFADTVWEDIAYGPRNMKLSEKEVKERVERSAYFCGISKETLEKSPFDLSGGQKRRVAIAGVVAITAVQAQ